MAFNNWLAAFQKIQWWFLCAGSGQLWYSNTLSYPGARALVLFVFYVCLLHCIASFLRVGTCFPL